MFEGGPQRAFRIEPYSYPEARALAEALGVSEPLAVTLVRRGYRTVDEARAFLDAAEHHDPFAFQGMEEAVERLLAAIRTGRRITVHGDYDVDGVCSTAILVAGLRELGADCDWLIPDRLDDGYGLSEATVSRLAARGTGLLLTTDCGITCPAEVALAREAGMEVIVTDHHAPGERLPDCPILHPRLSAYPCPDLCATGVAYKLAAAIRSRAGANPDGADRDLDLVALATVADLVPLTGENRSLVRRGLGEMRRGGRVGLRALMEVAGVEPSRLDEGDLAFRLGPRINAAGRLYRADAGVELLLCAEEGRVAEIASELDRANRERRGAEQEVLAGAQAALRELPGELAEAPALVLAGQGWHPGVVGIAASRLAERHWRPVVLISLDASGRGRGSGRSVPAFDLLGALRRCGEHLVRFGGHRAAAGLEIDSGRVGEFRRDFVAYAREALAPADLVRTEAVDAVVGGDRLGMELAEELERLGPFGMGNPGVRLLVPAARIRDIRPMGEGRHARFSLESGPASALGVAFGSSLPGVDGKPRDLSVRLEVNQWNGSVEPRVVLNEIYDFGEPERANGAEVGARGRARVGTAWPGCEGAPPVPPPAEVGCAACPGRIADEGWWRRVDAAREAAPDEWLPAKTAADGPRRQRVECAGGSAVAVLADLLSSGAPVLGLCADVSRRRELAVRCDPRRFGGGEAVLACGRCREAALAEAADRVLAEERGLVLADWAALAREPGAPLGFDHLVLVDPPPFGGVEALSMEGSRGGGDGGFVHLTWGDAELEFALRVHEAEWDLRLALAVIFRGLRGSGGAAGADGLAGILAGEGPHRRSPEQAGRCVRVLEELGLVAWEGVPAKAGSDHEGALRVVSSVQTELERSAAYVAYRARAEEGRRFLSSQRRSR